MNTQKMTPTKHTLCNDVFPTPGGDNMDQVILPPPEPAAPTPESEGFEMKVRATGRTKDDAWGNLLTVLTEACSSKRERWEGEWPDYIDMNEGRIECVLITETPDLAAQLAAVTEELAETKKDYQCLASLLDGHDATECRMNLVRILKELAAVTKQRDILKEALEEIATGAWCIKTCVDVIAPRALHQTGAVIKGTE